MFSKFKDQLTTIEELTHVAQDEKGKDYVQPALKRLGAVNIVLVREVIAPTVFKNSDAEVTDIDLMTKNGPMQVVRAVPNKFKHCERGRGLQILREFGVGGKSPQNKSFALDDDAPSDFFDINSFVFGDSVNHKKSVLPAKAGVLYSDGISLSEYVDSVSKTFHNRASEDGTLFDAISKKNSSNIFDRHFIVPGTLLIETVSTVGRVMTPELMDHLLLSIGNGGSYGGQTSVSGINIRTHIAGVYGGKIERPEASPYLLASEVQGAVDVSDAIKKVHAILSPLHSASVEHEEVSEYLEKLASRLENGDEALKKQYEETAEKVGDLYHKWFTKESV